MIEGPFKKDVGSYLLSARRSYADLFLKLSGNENTVLFYDVNAKVNWNLGPKDKINMVVYDDDTGHITVSSKSGLKGFYFGNKKELKNYIRNIL